MHINQLLSHGHSDTLTKKKSKNLAHQSPILFTLYQKGNAMHFSWFHVICIMMIVKARKLLSCTLYYEKNRCTATGCVILVCFYKSFF